MSFKSTQEAGPSIVYNTPYVHPIIERETAEVHRVIRIAAADLKPDYLPELIKHQNIAMQTSLYNREQKIIKKHSPFARFCIQVGQKKLGKEGLQEAPILNNTLYKDIKCLRQKLPSEDDSFLNILWVEADRIKQEYKSLRDPNFRTNLRERYFEYIRSSDVPNVDQYFIYNEKEIQSEVNLTVAILAKESVEKTRKAGVAAILQSAKELK